MTVATTLAALAAKLATITSPQAFTRVWAQPQEQLSAQSFPLAMCALKPRATHTCKVQALGGTYRHNYIVQAIVVTGQRTAGRGLPELHDRTIPWIEPLNALFLEWVQLGGALPGGFVGGPNDATTFSYQVGPIDWGDGSYFGLTLDIPITEYAQATIGA